MPYCRPLLGLDGAGEGGRSWPSRSTWAKALLIAVIFGFGSVPEAGVDDEPDSDILVRREERWRDQLDDLECGYEDIQGHVRCRSK